MISIVEMFPLEEFLIIIRNYNVLYYDTNISLHIVKL